MEGRAVSALSNPAQTSHRDVHDQRGMEQVKKQVESLPTRRQQSSCDGHCAATTPPGQVQQGPKELLEASRLSRSHQTNNRPHPTGKPVVLAHLQQHLPSQGDHQSQEVLEDPNYQVAAAAALQSWWQGSAPTMHRQMQRLPPIRPLATVLRSASGPALLQSSQIDRLTQGMGRLTVNRQQGNPSTIAMMATMKRTGTICLRFTSRGIERVGYGRANQFGQQHPRERPF